MTDQRTSAVTEEAELYALRDLIASHIDCEKDCQSMPTGCGCALTAARAVLNRPAPAPAELWQERAPHGPWFVRTPHDGDIFFGSDKGSAEQCLSALNRHAQKARDPEVVAAVQEAIMRHPFWKPGLGSSGFAFGLANTAIDAYTSAITSTKCGADHAG